MKNKFYILTLGIVFAFIFTTSQAQDKPIRIGLKFGIPNIAGLNAEYVTPLLGEKLAASVDFSHFSLSSGDVKFSFSYFELGGNYYFMKKGKGPYGQLSFGRIGFKGTYSDDILGDGEGKLGINLLNVKIGIKVGNAFYFRPEIGYSSLVGSSTIKVEYTDPVTKKIITEEEKVPGVLDGGVVFNLGFGVAF
ncbi:MAG: hypothetical protein KAT68_09935 [Bacteroidales bacterium]|nr:hypothetical protein [Bacteroidales bacterium]